MLIPSDQQVLFIIKLNNLGFLFKKKSQREIVFRLNQKLMLVRLNFYHKTWEHEKISYQAAHRNFKTLEKNKLFREFYFDFLIDISPINSITH